MKRDQGRLFESTPEEIAASKKFRLSCRMLRMGGLMDELMPSQKPSESRIDWMVRIGLAPSAHIAADMLILAAGLTKARDELAADPTLEV